MKYQKKRRFGALVLALAMALSLAAPAFAADGDLTISGPTTVEPGKEVTLTAKLGDGIGPTDTNISVTYTWSTPSNVATITQNGTEAATVKAGDMEETVTITVVAEWQKSLDKPNDKAQAEATFTLKIKAATAPTEPEDPGPIPVTGVTLSPAVLNMNPGDRATLTATFQPADATNQALSWTTSDRTVATVSNGVVTAVGEGTATIRATALDVKDGSVYAECTVTVTNLTAYGITFSNESKIIWGKDTRDRSISVYPLPSNAQMPSGSEIKWAIETVGGGTGKPPAVPEGENGLTVTPAGGDPGDYNITAELWVDGAKKSEVSRMLTISGITLSAEELEVKLDGYAALSIKEMYGDAAAGNLGDVMWTSSDPTIITVMYGELVAWKTGTAIITATKNGYTATCRVTVVEDTSAIIDVSGISTGKPLTFDMIDSELDRVSHEKTIVEGYNEEGSDLDYITNVSVPTDQGTLYYNYDSEANTGAGVGATDRFCVIDPKTGRPSNPSIQQTLDLLFFVPRQGYSGTAEISFNGRAKDGTGFTGIVRVEVENANNISYRTNAGEAVTFVGSDFNSFCRGVTGRDLNYVTFNLPQTSQGTLYYNYTAPGQYGDRVTTSSQYARSGRYLIDEVSFVPNDAFVGDVSISFRGVDTAGKAFNGEVVVTVVAPTAGETANIYISAQRGQPVALPSNLFNDACQATIRDTLSYVNFKQPSFDEGVLYYNYRGTGNYDSRVGEFTRYYYSGVPGINNVSFVPASSNTGRVAIRYTGYGVGGTTYTGTVYISVEDTERSTVRYFVSKNGVVDFRASDFNVASLFQMGVSMEYVEFEQVENIHLGTLYYDYGSNEWYNSEVGSKTAYYRNPGEYQNALNKISFHAGAAAGTVIIPYTAYSAVKNSAGDRDSFKGTVMIQIGSPTPENINFSIASSGQAWLSSYTFDKVCGPVMNGKLSYIEITSVPPAEQGKLYRGYYGFKTGTEVKQGDRFYCLGTPSIDMVSFVPHGGYSGTTEITYIGYSSDGKEQVSGRIFVEVSKSASSKYFNDLGWYTWAVDAVDFLYQNGTTIGVGDNRYDPSGYITKGDFTLMLVRTFGFTASGRVTYSDVPADSHYANAISVASQLGIVSGSGSYFYPTTPLTRQDAMLMIYNALVADGWQLTNGLAVNLDRFSDATQIAGYARAAVGVLVEMGIVQGDGAGHLLPTTRLNRAEVAMMMHAVMTL